VQDREEQFERFKERLQGTSAPLKSPKKSGRKSSSSVDNRTTTYVGGIRFYTNDVVKRVRLLGRGNYGNVYLAKIQLEYDDEDNDSEGTKVAMKVQKRTDGFSPEMMRELQAMTAVPPHRNVVELVGMLPFGEKGKRICFLTSYCEKGSLDKLHNKVDMVSPAGYRDPILTCKSYPKWFVGSKRLP